MSKNSHWLKNTQATPSEWAPGDEVIPTDFRNKVAYFLKKYREGSMRSSKDGTSVGDNSKMVEEEPVNSGSQEQKLSKIRTNSSINA